MSTAFRSPEEFKNPLHRWWHRYGKNVPLLLSVLSLGFSAFTFVQNKRLTSDARAMDLYLKWSEKVPMPLVSVGGGKYAVKPLLATDGTQISGLSIAEEIYRLQKGDPSWEETVGLMLEAHRNFFETKPRRDTYSQEFANFAEKRLSLAADDWEPRSSAE